jgi:hypothetical protein
LLFSSPNPDSVTFTANNEPLFVAHTAGHGCTVCSAIDGLATEENTFVDSHVAEGVLGTPDKLWEWNVGFYLHKASPVV